MQGSTKKLNWFFFLDGALVMKILLIVGLFTETKLKLC